MALTTPSPTLLRTWPYPNVASRIDIAVEKFQPFLVL